MRAPYWSPGREEAERESRGKDTGRCGEIRGDTGSSETARSRAYSIVRIPNLGRIHEKPNRHSRPLWDGAAVGIAPPWAQPTALGWRRRGHSAAVGMAPPWA